MSDLVAFLTARLDEDEDIARYTQQESLSAALKTMSGDGRHKLFLARHDPARVLREVEAKRRILAHAQAAEQDVPDIYAYDLAADYVLRALAAVYAGHPDYDEAWACDTSQ